MSKRISFLALGAWLSIVPSALAQVQCLQCFHQDAPLNATAPNLVLNSGFELGPCSGGGYFCPNSSNYSCDIPSWTCTGGGTSTYAQLLGSGFSTVPEGTHVAYMGNFYAYCCSNTDGDTLCLSSTGCITSGLPPGYPSNTPEYGGATGLSLSQTVTGLTVGNTYSLEFWAGGEGFGFLIPGLFAVDIGFGNIFLRCAPTTPGVVGTRYLLVFQANATSHTIKFTNWGHITSSNSEVILDDIRLYSSPGVTAAFDVQFDGCGTTVQLTEQSSAGVSYAWDMGDGTTFTTPNVTHTYQGAGTYTITLTVTGLSCGGTQSVSHTVTVIDPPAVEALFEAVQIDPCNGLIVSTTNMSTGPATLLYTWNMGDGTTLSGDQVVYSYLAAGIYTISLTALDTVCGVADTATVQVTVKAVPLLLQSLAVPNVFSPNGDGLNDSFFPIANAGDEVTLRIWNRFGQLIYETSAGYKPWNGRVGSSAVPDGVYFYLLEYRIPCTGKVIEGSREGHVQLLGSPL